MEPFHLAALWQPKLSPWEVVTRSAIMYVALQVVLRLAGRKEWSRWALPEIGLMFLVTTAVRESLVADDRSLTSGLLALVTIAALDWLLSTALARSPRVGRVVLGPIRRLVRDGQLQRRELLRSRLSEEDLLSRVRERGGDRLEDVQDAYLERNGSVSVIFKASGAPTGPSARAAAGA